MKKDYVISVHGCDDSTEFEMELTDHEAEVVMRLAELCTKTSTYGCMPTMGVREGKLNEEEDQHRENV